MNSPDSTTSAGSGLQQPGSTAVDGGGGGLRRNRLGALPIVAIVVSAVAPVSVIAAGAPVVFAISGAATPAIYVLAGVLFALFSVGYVAMARHISNAGGFVAYIARGLGVRVATAAAAVTLLFYLASLVAFYALSGAVAASTFGLDASPTLVGFVALAIVGVVGHFGIGLSMRLLMVLLALEIGALLVVDVAILLQGGPDGFSLEGFTPSQVFSPGVGVALLVSIICFSGLEATVVLAEEAKEPRRTIPRAVYGALAFITVFYALTTWLLSVSAGVSSVQDVAGADPGSFFFVQAEAVVGPTFTRVLELLVLSSFLALFIGFQSLVARYVFALGRSGLLPRVLGSTDSRRNPAAASVAVTVSIGLVLAGFALAGADPVTVTYAWLVGLGTVGLLLLLVVTSVSIVVFFARSRVDTRVWPTRIAPSLAILGVGAALVLALQNYSLLGGTDSAASWLLLLIPVAAAAGWSAVGRRTRRGLDTDYAADLGA